ncbi:hypothetical protein D3C87_1925440 [compost metagenome]
MRDLIDHSGCVKEVDVALAVLPEDVVILLLRIEPAALGFQEVDDCRSATEVRIFNTVQDCLGLS